MWKTIKKGDYLYGLVPDHPNATKNGYVLEHRLRIEDKLKRFLSSDEVVHHKDGDKHNNKIENLEVMSRSEHTRLHATKGRNVKTLVCPNCGKSFTREVRNIKPNTTPKCSRKCNGEWSRKKQLSKPQVTGSKSCQGHQLEE